MLTAGSDDHSGAYTASAFTKTPLASGVDEYLAFLRRGDHEADGACGGSVLMGHAFYHIAYSYYQHRFIRGNGHPVRRVVASRRSSANSSSGC